LENELRRYGRKEKRVGRGGREGVREGGSTGKSEIQQEFCKIAVL